MPFRRKRKVRLTRGKNALKHSATDIVSHGPGTIPTEIVLLATEAGARSTTGSAMDVQSHQRTGNETMTSSICKYYNLILETGVKPATEGASSNGAVGFLEWAVVMVKQTETSVPNTNIGIQTLMDICQQMYRNECILTGAIPISRSNPNCGNIQIQVPKTKCNIKIGDEWRLYFYYRDLTATATETDSCKTIVTTMFKTYN